MGKGKMNPKASSKKIELNIEEPKQEEVTSGILENIPVQSTNYSESTPVYSEATPVKKYVSDCLANDIEVEITNEDKVVFIKVKPKINPDKENRTFLSACYVGVSDNNKKEGISQGLQKNIGFLSSETQYQFQVQYYGNYYFIITSYYTNLETGELHTEDQTVTYSVSEK